jgi:hypothetical protein
MKARIWEISACIIPLLICATCLGQAISAPAEHGKPAPGTKRQTALTLTIQMDNPQPSGAPVILRTVIENVGDQPVTEEYESFLNFKAILTSPIDFGSVSSILCSLGNIGTRLGNATLTYDGNSQRITHCSTGLSQANAMLTKQYRWPHTLAYTG